MPPNPTPYLNIFKLPPSSKITVFVLIMQSTNHPQTSKKNNFAQLSQYYNGIELICVNDNIYPINS